MADREKFEAWYVTQPLFTSLAKVNDEYMAIGTSVAWEAYQAGVSSSGRDDLLAACKAALDNDEVSEGFGARNMEDDLRQQLREAIQKAE